MKLNLAGEIIEKYWKELENKFNITLYEYVIMPNHIHLIVEICGEVVTEQCSVTTVNGKNYGLLSKIVKSYKNAVTKEINKMYPKNNFKWQRSYHDHIIRKPAFAQGYDKAREESLQKI